MATIYYTTSINRHGVFVESNLELADAKLAIDELDEDPNNFDEDGEQIQFYHIINKDMEEYEFYGYSSQEEMDTFCSGL